MKKDWLAGLLLIANGFAADTLTEEPTVVFEDDHESVVLNLPSIEREKFQLALSALRKGQRAEFNRLSSELQNYVLAPYLQQAYLLDRIDLNHRAEINAFLDQYQDQPVTLSVRHKYLRLLARKNQTALFLNYYRPLNDTKLECHYLRFRLKTKENRDDIFSRAEQLWLYGKSRPDSCDPVFAELQAAGRLSERLVWQRLTLAVEQRQSSLVRYLTSLLSPSLQDVGQWAQSVVVNPQRLKQPLAASIDNQKAAEVATHILEKLIWRDSEQALSLYQAATEHMIFSYPQKRALARSFALALASADHPDANQWLQNIPVGEQDELLMRWKLAHELRQQNWAQVDQWLYRTPPPVNAEDNWAYWKGRSSAKLGREQESQMHFKQLAKQRSYYGFMASSLVGVKPNLQQQSDQFDENIIQRISQNANALRAFELWQLNKNLSARREWNRFKAYLTNQEQRHVAVLAHRWGWHEQAIIALAENGQFNEVNMRFPLAYQELIEQVASQQEFDPTLSFAIARRESAFMSDARSSVGATGLMQIMPYTARHITKSHKLPRKMANQLTDPAVNVELGTRYLKTLVHSFEGNAVLATASYNAGKHKVTNWLPKENNLPADIWIEVVPYKETRDYIKNVLAYQQIYRTILGYESNYFDELIHLEIPSAK